MNATPRMKALFASSAALLVFGVIIPANANPDRPARTDTEFVGQAHEKAQPNGQGDKDNNRGFTCDDNRGAGQPGHPALPHDCDADGSTEPVAPGDSGDGGSEDTKTNNAGGNSHDNSGGGSGAGKGDVQDYPGGT